MVIIELTFLLVVGYGVALSGQRLVIWGFHNADRAERATLELSATRRSLINKICDAEVELSSELEMLDPSSSLANLLGCKTRDLAKRNFLDIVAPHEKERARTFLENASQQGESACVHLTLEGPSSAREVRVYHAAHNGQSTSCQHLLALTAAWNMEPHTDSGSNLGMDDCPTLVQTFKAFQSSLPSFAGDPRQTDTRSEGSRSARSMTNPDRSAGSRSMTDTLVVSENTWLQQISQSRGTQTQVEPVSEPVYGPVSTSEVGTQTGAQPAGRPPRPPPAGAQRRGKAHFSGRTVPSRKVIHPGTIRFLLTEVAKRVNVRGSGCCEVHTVFKALRQQVGVVLSQVPCKKLNFCNAWQCSECRVLHAEDEDAEEDGFTFCDVCGSEAPPTGTEQETSPVCESSN